MPAPTRFSITSEGQFTAVLDNVAAAATTLSLPAIAAGIKYVIERIHVRLQAASGSVTTYSVDITDSDGTSYRDRINQPPTTGLPATTWFQEIIGPIVCLSGDQTQIQVNTAGLTTPGISIAVHGRTEV